MPKGKKQKLKLYYLANIMRKKTDDEHGITIKEMQMYLAKHECTADRKSLYDDLAALEVMGLDIIGEQIGGSYPRHVDRFLGDISFACKENGLPPLSAIVVNKEDYIPGAGFFSAYFPGNKIKKEKRDEIIMGIYKELREYPYWDKVLEKYKNL